MHDLLNGTDWTHNLDATIRDFFLLDIYAISAWQGSLLSLIKFIWKYVMRSEKSYTKLGRKISILRFKWKYVKVVPNNIFVKVSDYCVKLRLCNSKKNLFCRNAPLYFPYQSKTVVISSQMDLRMQISIKNWCRTFIYLSINIYNGVIFFFFFQK